MFSTSGVECCEGLGGSEREVAPPEVAGHEVAGGEGGVGGGDHAADCAAQHDLVDGPGIGVRGLVPHAAAHVGVDGHPLVADQYLARGGVGHVHLDEFEVGGVGQPLGARAQPYLAASMAHQGSS